MKHPVFHSDDFYAIADKLDQIIDLLTRIKDRLPLPYYEDLSLGELVLATQPKKGFLPSVKRILSRVKKSIVKSWNKFQSYMNTQIIITTKSNTNE